MNFLTFTSWLQIGVDDRDNTFWSFFYFIFPILCYMVISEHPNNDLTINNNLFQELIKKIFFILWLFIVVSNRNLVTLTQNNFLLVIVLQKNLITKYSLPNYVFYNDANFCTIFFFWYIGVIKNIKPHSISIYYLMDLILINFHIIHNSNKW